MSGPYGTENMWDHMSYNGQAGFVPDAWVYTGSNNAVAPSCGGNGVIIIQPCLNVRQGPSGKSSLVGCIPQANSITVDCTTLGTSVTGPYGATSLWDHTSYNGTSGYVSDAYVYTGVSQAVAPECSGPRTGSGTIDIDPCLNLRGDSNGSSPLVGCIPNNTTIPIDCVKQGSNVTGPYGTESIWDYTTYNGVSGYVADAFVYTGTNAAVASQCQYVAPKASTAVGAAQASSGWTGCVSGHYPINCASGDFWHSFTDLKLPERGPDLELGRTYNGLAPGQSGLFGYGWSSSWDEHFVQSTQDGSFLIYVADGSTVIAVPNASGGYTTPGWSQSSFIANTDGSYTFTTESGLVAKRFAASGRLLSISDRNGDTTNFGYSDSTLTKVTDPAGRVINLTANTAGRITAVTDPLGRSTAYTYDDSGNLTGTSDAAGRAWQFTYDANHRMLTMTDPRGGVVTNVYDGQGRVSAQTDPAGLTTRYSFDGDNYSDAGGTTTVTDPHGMIEKQSYVDGFLRTLVKASGTQGAATWSYTYDPATLGQTSATDPDGNATTRTFDMAGRELSSTDPLNHTTTTIYNELGEPLTVTTPLGQQSSKTYDARGNMLTSTDPAGGVTTNTYGDSAQPGDLTAISDPDGHLTDVTYNANGDVESTTTHPSAGKSAVTRSTYDADGELVCKVAPVQVAQGTTCPAVGAARKAGTTSYIYDQVGELLSTTTPAGATTTNGWDADGNKKTMADPDGRITAWTYDGDNRITSRTTGSGTGGARTTRYAYDVAPGSGNCPDGVGYCTSSTDASGAATVTAHDLLGHTVFRRTPMGHITTFTYDAAGNQLTQTAPDGTVTTSAYDQANHLVRRTYSDENMSTVSLGYDADGKRTSMTDGSGTTTYSYDKDARLVQRTDGSGATVAYTYDAAGLITAITYPSGQQVTRAYDTAGQLVSVTDWNNHTTTFGYDVNGELTTTAYPNTDTVATSYNADSQPTATTVASAGGTALGSLRWTVDPAGLITKESTVAFGPATTTYAYDSNNQLASTTIGSTTTAYSYDAAGNLTRNGAATQQFNDDNQLTTAATGSTTTSYDYDRNGELTGATTPDGRGTADSYDAAGHLVSHSVRMLVPRVTALSPATGRVAGGANVAIAGSGFTGATSVTFGGVAASKIQVTSATRIVATVPAANKPGAVDVVVTGPAGASDTSTAARYTYLPTPRITSITPKTANTAGGAQITVTGTAFTSASSVLFGTTKTSTLTLVSDSKLVVTAPAQSAGRVDLHVTTPGGTSPSSTADLLSYQDNVTDAPPSTVTPMSPPTAGTPAATRYAPVVAARYGYDGDGLRASESTARGAQHFVFDTTSTVPTVLTDDTNAYVYGPGGLPVEQIATSGGNTAYFVHGTNGSTRALLAADGSIQSKLYYGAYGTPSTTTAATPLLYAQSYADAASGYDYLINRWYNPAVGQFTSVDPDLETTGQPYAYADNNPINENDPNGLFGWSSITKHWRGIAQVGIAVGLAVAVAVLSPGFVAGVAITALGAALNYEVSGGSHSLAGFVWSVGANVVAGDFLGGLLTSDSPSAGGDFKGRNGGGTSASSAGSGTAPRAGSATGSRYGAPAPASRLNC